MRKNGTLKKRKWEINFTIGEKWNRVIWSERSSPYARLWGGTFTSGRLFLCFPKFSFEREFLFRNVGERLAWLWIRFASESIALSMNHSYSAKVQQCALWKGAERWTHFSGTEFGHWSVFEPTKGEKLWQNFYQICIFSFLPHFSRVLACNFLTNTKKKCFIVLRNYFRLKCQSRFSPISLSRLNVSIITCNIDQSIGMRKLRLVPQFPFQNFHFHGFHFSARDWDSWTQRCR